MTRETKSWTVCRVVLTLFVLLLADGAGFAQSLTVLHTFSQTSGGNPSGTAVGTNPDGAGPLEGLLNLGSMLYGTTDYGGTGSGTIFGINTNGTGFTNLHTFSVLSGNPQYHSGTNSDGAYPNALLNSGSFFYGVTIFGGLAGHGTIFKLNTDGTHFSTLYNFTNGNDGEPLGGLGCLVLSGGMIYGVGYKTMPGTGGGWVSTVYEISTNGSGFDLLYQSAETGSIPAGITASGGILYFSANMNGNESSIYSLMANGMGIQTLWPLDASTEGYPIEAAITVVNDVLYGTATQGGPMNSGTMFSIPVSGGELTVLHAFSAGQGNFPVWSNYDGVGPGSVTVSGGMVFGTCELGGAGATGVIYVVNTNGTGFQTLYNFSAFDSPYSSYGNCEGGYPYPGPICVGNTLYGTCYCGGIYGSGTIYALSIAQAPISLNFQWTDSAVVLSWTNAAFALQSAPTVSGVYTNVPGASSPYTNAVTGLQMFFRLVTD